jgi:stage II sporulation protein D (peptidoglycan lytic transglycosylase)
MPRLRFRRSTSAGATLVAGALLATAIACRGTLNRAPEPVVVVSTVPADTARRDTVAADTAFPMMPAPGRQVISAPIRVLVANAAPTASIGATGRWSAIDRDGSSLAAGDDDAQWTVAVRSGRLRLSGGRGGSASSLESPLTIRALDATSRVVVNGRAYRGELLVLSSGDEVIVVNRLPIEDYLRGVVPLEIGERQASEHAAVEAQAIAARSYAYTHRSLAERFDVRATVDDQVYGGAGAERAVSDAAVAATAGAVLRYAGRIADTPYHSTCGGMTAEPSEVWTGESGAPYLRRVDDHIPGSRRAYCDISPRYEWTREMTGAEVGAAVTRYLRSRGSSVQIGVARSLSVESRTPSGRVGTLAVDGSAGETTLRGNAIRYALKVAGGELLNSTYFSIESSGSSRSAAGRHFTLHGHGYGHGIGMCQWGAIGRARAGQDAVTILQTYYPGTSVGIAE